MASTKKKKVKEEEVKEVIIEKKEEFPSSLASDHLLQLETKSRDIENAKLLMALEEQSLRNMSLELIILQRKVEDQKKLVKEKAVYYDNMVKQFKQIKSELWPQYGFKLEEGLGYNPETGEIIKDNKN